MSLRHLVSTAIVTGALAVSPALAAKKTDRLLAAGFVDRPANTPARADMLARLPAKKFVRRANGDYVTYVYADPKGCNCLYVGDQRAYGRYQQQKQAEQIADDNEMAAQDYNDAAWNWGAWGPWGGRFGRFGFHGGLGW